MQIEANGKPRFRAGQQVIVSKLRVRLVKKEGACWIVCLGNVSGVEFPCYPNELRPLTAREIGQLRRAKARKQ